MSSDPIEPVRPAVVGIAAIAACANAVATFAFAPNSNVAIVLGVSAAIGAALALIAYHGIVRPLVFTIGTARSQQAITHNQLLVARNRRALLEQLDVAIERAMTEDQVVELVGSTLATLFDDRDNAVLLAPPTGGRVTWMIDVTADGLGEPIILDRAVACRALEGRTTVNVALSSDSHACAHVAHEDCEVSALCVPILIGDQHLGVAHSMGAPGDTPDVEAVRILETIARRCGARIAELRAERRHDYTLPVDPITQLANETLAYREIRHHLVEGTTFAVAICDIDNFDAYNAEHGSDAGDAALRRYADVLMSTLRPTDVISRADGDRFICVFTNCTSLNAAAAMERARESLILDATLGEIPPFGVSVGIAASTEADSTEELVDLSITAIAAAKVAGGNRVVRTEALDTAV